MFKINGNEISITRGDSASFSVTLKHEDESAYSLDPEATITFTVKKDTSQPKSLIKKTNTGDTSFTLAPEDTSSLKYGEYVYDIQLNVGEEVLTVVEPTLFTVTEEVTW